MGSPIEPSPKSIIEGIREKASWRATSVLNDVRLKLISDRSFDDVFEGRRTRQAIDAVQLHETLAFVKHVFSPRQFGKGRLAGLTRKTIISAGALHPLDVVILSGAEVSEPIIFSDRSKKFLTLPILNQEGFDAALEKALLILPNSTGHLVLFAGDKRRVSKAYDEPDTLLLRDGGAAAQVCSMAAYAYGYGYCPLGYTGSALLAALGPPHKDFVALGLGLFGR